MKWVWAAAGVVAAAAVAGFLATDGSGAVARGIAYVTGNASSPPQIWIAGSDGSGARRLGAGARPLLSPDGSIVATSAVGSGGPALILYSATGATLRRSFDLRAATATALAWSPDSRYLAVALASTDPASNAASGLAVLDARSGAAKLLARGTISGASFAPDGSDRLVYASAATQALAAPVNVHATAADGSGSTQLTRDGRSLNPVWGPGGIAFDRQRLRSAAAPAYQVWLMDADGAHPRQLTHLRVPLLLDGLVPRQFDHGGGRLLAEYAGQDTSEAWLIETSSGHARRLEVAGRTVTGAAIEQSGAAALVDSGGFLNPPDAGSVVSLELDSGHSRTLIEHASDPSWNL
jgi:hypothetical protein